MFISFEGEEAKEVLEKLDVHNYLNDAKIQSVLVIETLQKKIDELMQLVKVTTQVNYEDKISFTYETKSDILLPFEALIREAATVPDEVEPPSEDACPFSP